MSRPAFLSKAILRACAKPPARFTKIRGMKDVLHSGASLRLRLNVGRDSSFYASMGRRCLQECSDLPLVLCDDFRRSQQHEIAVTG